MLRAGYEWAGCTLKARDFVTKGCSHHEESNTDINYRRWAGPESGLGAGGQEPKAAQETKKDWKGQEEYNLFQAYQKADPKGRIEALDKWKAAFPASDFAEEREEQYLFVYQQLNMNREAFDKAAEILKTRPNHFYSLSAIERLIYTLPAPPKPADLDTTERVSKYLLDNLDTVFAPANKPSEVKDADWTTYKPAMKNAAQATLAWVYVQRKDHAEGRDGADQVSAPRSHPGAHLADAGRRTPGAESGSSRKAAAGSVSVRPRGQLRRPEQPCRNPPASRLSTT